MTKGITPKISRFCFCVLINKRSFEPFMCLDLTGVRPGRTFAMYIFEYFFVPCGKFGSPYLDKAQQPQEQRYPFLSVCAVFSFVQTVVWLQMFRNFNMHTDVDACDCTRGLYGHRKRVCTGS